MFEMEGQVVVLVGMRLLRPFSGTIEYLSKKFRINPEACDCSQFIKSRSGRLIMGEVLLTTIIIALTGAVSPDRRQIPVYHNEPGYDGSLAVAEIPTGSCR